MQSPAQTFKMPSQVEIDNAFSKVKQQIEIDGGSTDLAYFGHEVRYRRNVSRILELVPPGATILDVGSHFLHQAAVLRILGYRVFGMDVHEFVDQPQIKGRAITFDIQNYVVDRFDRGDFLVGKEEMIDLVVFSEIQEHITFNPVLFWRRIWRLMRVGGKIFLTTPNSMNLVRIVSALKNLLLLKGLGCDIDQILGTVTYGHHWKEYSAYELRLLFDKLSPDWTITVTPYELSRPDDASARLKRRGIKPIIQETLQQISSRIPRFRDQLEAVIILEKRSEWTTSSPDYF